MDLLIFVWAACFELCSADVGNSRWAYDDEAHWPGVCREGKQQSPVNIATRAALTDVRGDVIRGALQLRRYAAVQLRGLNNGHTVKFAVEGDPDSRPTLSGGPLRRDYQLDQLHFHWLGEHALDFVKYPLEIHLVHRRSDLAPAEALHNPDGLAVVAVLCQLSAEPGAAGDGWALQQISDIVPGLINVSSETAVGKVDLLRLLGDERDSYYTYEGSLTTPGCQEVTTWLVLAKPLRFTDQQYKVFSKVQVGGVSNFRSLQPLHGRTVYRSGGGAGAAAGSPQQVVAGAATAAAGALAAASGTAALLSTLMQSVIDAALAFKTRVFGLDFHVKH